MADFKPILKTTGAEIPVEDGQFIASTAPGERGIFVDFDGKRNLVTGEGTAVTVGGALQASVSFTSDPQVQLNEVSNGLNEEIERAKAAEATLATLANKKVLPYSATAWQGSVAPYTMTIPASVHDKGILPVWRFKDNQHFSGESDVLGNITLESNVKKAFTIIIF